MMVTNFPSTTTPPPIRKYNLVQYVSYLRSLQNLNNIAYAIEYAKAGLHILACSKLSKVPLVDKGLGMVHGLHDASNDPHYIARIWHKHPEANVAWALPCDIIVIDCDVLKDKNKNPIMDSNGNVIPVGFNAFKKIADEHAPKGSEISTLTTRTQSGGVQFFFRLTGEQQKTAKTEITNRSGIFDHVDLKTCSGYVLLPPSIGKYGRYIFLTLTDIAELPDWLFNVILKKYEPSKMSHPYVPASVDVDPENLMTVANLLLPYWQKADGRRNDMSLAIDGALARLGVNVEQRKKIVSELCRRTGKGCDHINAVGYSDKKLKSGHRVKGFRSLEQLIDEIGGVNP